MKRYVPVNMCGQIITPLEYLSTVRRACSSGRRCSGKIGVACVAQHLYGCGAALLLAIRPNAAAHVPQIRAVQVGVVEPRALEPSDDAIPVVLVGVVAADGRVFEVRIAKVRAP